MPWTDNDVSFKKLNNKRITTSTGKGIMFRSITLLGHIVCLCLEVNRLILIFYKKRKRTRTSKSKKLGRAGSRVKDRNGARVKKKSTRSKGRANRKTRR